MVHMCSIHAVTPYRVQSVCSLSPSVSVSASKNSRNGEKPLEHWIVFSQHAFNFGFTVAGGRDVVIQELWASTFGLASVGRNR